MGLTFSSLFDSLSSLTGWRQQQDVRILCLGLDAAGKTTLLYQLQVSIIDSFSPVLIVPLARRGRINRAE